MRVTRFVRLRSGFRPTFVSGLVSLWIGCSSAADSGRSASSDAGPFPNGTNGQPSATGGSGNGAVLITGGQTSAPELPPEKEKESAFKLPVLSGRWVWSANAESGRVAVIDTRTLGVQLTQAGHAPSYLAPLVASGDVRSAAVVLNEKSEDASVMRLGDDGVHVTSVPTHVGANAWAVSPSGRWAIAWSDASTVTNPDPADSFQDITVIDTRAEPVTATRLSAGYRPSRLFFRSDEGRAFVVSDAGVTIIELGGAAPFVSEDVALSAVPNEKPIDVAVIPQGTHALFRVEGSPNVSIVALETGSRSDIPLSGPVTDLDLVADGTSAIAVVRGQPFVVPDVSAGRGSAGEGGEESGGNGGIPVENGGAAGSESTAWGAGVGGQAATGGDGAGMGAEAGSGVSRAGAGGMGGADPPKPSKPPASGYGPSEVAVFSIAGVLAEPSARASILLDDLVGSVVVSNEGSMAVLYTTATTLDRVTVLPTDASKDDYLTARATRVRAPVDAVFISPDATHALVALRATPGSAIGGAFGIVPLANPALVKIQPTDAPVTGVAFGAQPTSSAILTAATGQTAYLVHFPALRVNAVALPSLPLAAGVIAEEGVGYVVEQHPDGRLSLINLESGEPRTLTGFELSAGVNDGQ
jgi:hypothetical protein